MINYFDILKKIDDIKEYNIDEFNEKISIPMFLAKGDSRIITNNQDIIIENEAFRSVITLETRKAFFEIIFLMKNIDRDLYNKIPFMYVDYFEKFKLKDSQTEYSFNDDFENFYFSETALSIISILNIKFWCVSDSEKKLALEKLIKKEISRNEKKLHINEKSLNSGNSELNSEDSTYLVKNNIWINILNKFRKLIEKLKNK